MKKKISVVITDLDNTLFDWFEIWYNSFNAMLTCLVEKTGIPSSTLEEEFKAVHQKHGTAEYAFSLEELPSLKKMHPDGNIPDIYHDCIQAYRDARRAVMRLYPGVLETLSILRGKGCLLVGYTESKAFYSHYRVTRFGLDGILDYLYSPADHDIPKNIDIHELRKYGPDEYTFRYTDHRHTPEGELKPNPDLLNAIIKEVGADPQQTIYIGDSPMKDVGMAQEASVIDVWAKYGASSEDPRYELLRKVTHWTKEDVEREKKLTNPANPAMHTLQNSFDEILDLFEFTEHIGSNTAYLNTANLPETITVWEKTVDVQQHFNDLCLRIRNYAIALLTAVLAFSALTLKEGYVVKVKNHSIPLASILMISAVVPLVAFLLMDLFWYHRLLLGAVRNGLNIEKTVKRVIPGIQLTTEIGNASPFYVFKWEIHSNLKLLFFYGLMVLFLVIAAVAVWCGHNYVEASDTTGNTAGASGQSVVIEKIDVNIPKDFANIHLDVIPKANNMGGGVDGKEEAEIEGGNSAGCGRDKSQHKNASSGNLRVNETVKEPVSGTKSSTE